MKKSEKAMDFEIGLSELECLVEALEAGDMKLDESFAAYEKGIRLMEALEKQLSGAEKKIALLTQRGEEPIELEVEKP